MMESKKPWGFCETPEEKCTMNYCDENGCQNRKRNLVPTEDLFPKKIKLSKSLAKMVKLMSDNLGEEFPKVKLFNCIKGNECVTELDYFQSRSFDVHLSRIRKFIKQEGKYELVKSGWSSKSKFKLVDKNE